MRNAFVTGGAGGLGPATAARFASDDMAVAIADLQEAPALEAAAALAGGGHLGIGLDVSGEASVQVAFEAEALGPVSVLACFAGILSTSSEPGRIPLIDLTLDE